MGLKSGSRNAGLDDADEDDDPAPAESGADAETTGAPPGRTSDDATESASAGSGADARTRPSTADRATPATEGPEAEPPSSDESAATRPTVDSLPYTLRRDKVNEGREQVPFFLREEVVDGEADLRDALAEMLGEDVYKSDYREAAMVVAQRNPALVAEVLREWGYDLDAA